jgi:hypothetical protein
MSAKSLSIAGIFADCRWSAGGGAGGGTDGRAAGGAEGGADGVAEGGARRGGSGGAPSLSDAGGALRWWSDPGLCVPAAT